MNIHSGIETKHCGANTRGLQFEACFSAFLLYGTGLGSAIGLLQISSDGAWCTSLFGPSHALWHIKDCGGRWLERFFNVENEKGTWVSAGVTERVQGSVPHGHVHRSREG